MQDDRIEQWRKAMDPVNWIMNKIEAEQTAHAYHENLIREGTKHLRLTVLEACINLGEHPDHAYLMLDRIREEERNARMKCRNT